MMKTALALLLGLPMALLSPAGAQVRTPAQAAALPPATMRPVGIISGGIDGTYARIAADLAAVLDDGQRMRVVPMLGKGSMQNMDDLLHLRGVDVAIVQSDVLSFIKTRQPLPGMDRIGYIAKLYDEEVHVLAGPGITSLGDLAGKPVNVDVVGSGTALTASVLFGALHVAIQTVNDDQASALEKLRRGQIAAMVYVAGKPARLFAAVDGSAGLHFLPVPLTSALLESYVPARLETADYPGLVPAGGGVDTVAVGAVLATYAWPAGTDGYRRIAAFTEQMFGSFAKFKQPPRHAKWKEVNLRAQTPGWTRFKPATDWLEKAEAARKGT